MKKQTWRNQFGLLSILCCIFLASFSVHANEDKFRIEHKIDSKFPSEERTFTVQLPESYFDQSIYKYPVLYLLDGESNLDYSQTVAEFLSNAGTIPEVIIVGIHAGNGRARDYLPNIGEKSRLSGKANQFLNFIEKELISFIEGKYRAAGFRMLSGHSLGGLFVTHAMMEKSELFQAYFAQSPYLGASIGMLILSRMKQFVGKEPRSNHFYYLNVGDEPNLMDNFKKMEALLKTAPESFRWRTVHEAGKNHGTTRLIGQYDALEKFFARDWEMPQQKIVSGKFDGVKTHIDGLSKKFGYPVLYSVRHYVQGIRIFLQLKDANSATDTANLFKFQYPKSVIAHFYLAMAYRSAGNKEEGVKAIAEAFRLYEKNPTPSLKRLHPQMKRLQQLLTQNK